MTLLRTPPALSLRLRGPRRWLSATTRGGGAINLTPFASPLLLRLHPDRMARHAARHPQAARDNEDALKQLNQFLEIAAFGCNNDGYRARRQILALAAEHHDDPDAPIRWALRFHVQKEENNGDHEDGEETLTPVDHVVDVPAPLVRRTLAHGTRAASSNASDAMTASPFAREWQRTTKRVLQRLFEAAHVPLYQGASIEEEGTDARNRGTPTQLALWLEQEESEEAQRERGVATHNAAMHRAHRDFDKLFVGMLAKEKNIVHPTTTGLEDGPTTQHVILTRLISQRLFLEKIPDREEKRRVFFWLANILLMNFMELRLHALVWNKVVLMVTQDAALESPQVMWDSEQPEQGMAVLIPADMDAYALVDVLYEHVEELELALNENARRKTAQARRKQQQQQRKQQDPASAAGQLPKKKKHFYADEVNALFRRR